MISSFFNIFLIFKRLLFRLKSVRLNVFGSVITNQPVLFKGEGKIYFNGLINFGIISSPSYYNGYGYVEARSSEAQITINDGVWINNNCCIISDGAGITIDKDVLIGMNFTAFDTDFHNLDVDKRTKGIAKKSPIKIEQNVFIGANVTVLKGVNIGQNSVIATGSVVTKSIPANSIAGGNPCKVIRKIEE